MVRYICIDVCYKYGVFFFTLFKIVFIVFNCLVEFLSGTSSASRSREEAMCSLLVEIYVIGIIVWIWHYVYFKRRYWIPRQ